MTQVQTRQGEAHDVRSTIVEAAARLLHEGGLPAVTTRGVAAEAGVQAPTIYRIFGDKDGLLDAVAEHELKQYVGGKSAVPESDDPVTDLRAAWDRHIGFGLDRPAIFVRLVDPDRTSPVAAAGLEVLRARVHRIAVAGRLAVTEQRAVDLVHAAGTGAILTLLARPPELRDVSLADDMYDALMRTVLADEGVRGEHDPLRTAAITLRAVTPELSELSRSEQSLLSEWLDRVASPGG